MVVSSPPIALTRVEPRIIGTESKKQKDEFSFGFSPTALPAQKVVPLRLIPGKRARPCAAPTIIA